MKGHDGANECDPLAKSMHLMGAIMSYPRNMEILGEDEPADYVYKVTRGSVRTLLHYLLPCRDLNFSETAARLSNRSCRCCGSIGVQVAVLFGVHSRCCSGVGSREQYARSADHTGNSASRHGTLFARIRGKRWTLRLAPGHPARVLPLPGGVFTDRFRRGPVLVRIASVESLGCLGTIPGSCRGGSQRRREDRVEREARIAQTSALVDGEGYWRHRVRRVEDLLASAATEDRSPPVALARVWVRVYKLRTGSHLCRPMVSALPARLRVVRENEPS